jgi:hypothetical protein
MRPFLILSSSTSPRQSSDLPELEFLTRAPLNFVLTNLGASFPVNVSILRSLSRRLDEHLKQTPEATSLDLSVDVPPDLLAGFLSILSGACVALPSATFVCIATSLQIPQWSLPDAPMSFFSVRADSIRKWISRLPRTFVIQTGGKCFRIPPESIVVSPVLARHERVFRYDSDAFEAVHCYLTCTEFRIRAAQTNELKRICADLELTTFSKQIDFFIEKHLLKLEKLEKLGAELEESVCVQKMMLGLNSDNFKLLHLDIVNSSWFSGFDRIREFVIVLMSVVKIRESLHKILVEFVGGIENETFRNVLLRFLMADCSRPSVSFLYHLTKRHYYHLNEVVELIVRKTLAEAHSDLAEISLERIPLHFFWFLPEIKAYRPNLLRILDDEVNQSTQADPLLRALAADDVELFQKTNRIESKRIESKGTQ